MTAQNRFSFADLGPDQLLDALDSTGIRAESGLLALNSYENRVYQFTAEDGARYVTKFYRPQRWTDEQIAEEHQFTLALAEQDNSGRGAHRPQWPDVAPLQRSPFCPVPEPGRTPV